MQILIRQGEDSIAARPAAFENESELEGVLATTPDLLQLADDAALALVKRQVELPDAGRLDLLFVAEDGLPVAVEVKLARNAQARRHIVAQCIDYAASLTLLTVHELDALVEGALQEALASFPSEERAAFDRRWRAVDEKLRAGSARVIVVLDQAPADLERIARFLGERTRLDFRLVTLSKFHSESVGAMYVPRVVVAGGGGRPFEETPEVRPPPEKFAAVLESYNDTAPEELKTAGSAPTWRKIRRQAGWPPEYNVHYEFLYSGGISADLHIENDAAAFLTPILREFAGKRTGPGDAVLEWDPVRYHGLGRLLFRYRADTDPSVVADAMRLLIDITAEPVHRAMQEQLGKHSGQRPA